MYKVCHNYLLIKPRMDLDSVPEFFRLFYSSSQEVSLDLGLEMKGSPYTLYEIF